MQITIIEANSRSVLFLAFFLATARTGEKCVCISRTAVGNRAEIACEYIVPRRSSPTRVEFRETSLATGSESGDACILAG